MFTLEILFSKHLHLLLATTCIQYVEIFPVEALQLKPTPSTGAPNEDIFQNHLT